MKSLLKKYLPRTLFGRSLLILILPVILIQVITSYVFFDRHWSRMTTRFSYAVAGEIKVLETLYSDGVIDTREQKIIDVMANHLELRARYTADELDAYLRPSYGFWERLVSKILEHELRSQLYHDFDLELDFANKRLSIFVKMDNGVLVVEIPERRVFSSSGYIFLLWVLGASILLLSVSVLFMRNQIRPIRKLAVAAERFGKGQEVPKFKPEGAREVRQAATAFMDMRRRIKRQISQRTDMLAGISHDLRTPLTRLKLELEMLGNRLPQVTDMKQDVDDMERMISSYLDFVRGDGDEGYSYIDLGDLCERLLDQLVRQDHIGYLELKERIKLRVRPLLFERALNNIIQNAVKYGEHVWISAFIDDKKLQIQIEDDGPGVEEDFYNEIFKPFKRVDSSRNVDSGGVGLGLSISMDIIQGHGGNITLSKSQHGGLCVVVRLPL